MLDIQLKKHLNLDHVVVLDMRRSYRDGNLMWLNFEIIDEDTNPIMSFVYEGVRGESTKINEIVDRTNKSNDGKNFHVPSSTFKLQSAAANYWFKNDKKANSINYKTFADFMHCITRQLFEQVKIIIDNLDFFCLQVKKDYLKDKALVDEYINYWIKKTFDSIDNEDLDEAIGIFLSIHYSSAPLDDYWEERFKKLNISSTDRRAYWCFERSQEMFFFLSDEQAKKLDNFKKDATRRLRNKTL